MVGFILYVLGFALLASLGKIHSDWNHISLKILVEIHLRGPQQEGRNPELGYQRLNIYKFEYV